jgi:GNAT superfamily N-acetyltransferase
VNGQIDGLYIHGLYQGKGFGTKLLEYAVSEVGAGACINVPQSHEVLFHICEKLGLVKIGEGAEMIRMGKPKSAV